MNESVTKFDIKIDIEKVGYFESLAKGILDSELADGDMALLSMYFSVCFQDALDGMPREVPLHYWGLDDFCLNEFTESPKKFALRGVAYWLEGGDNCEHVHLDVERSDTHFRYSYKLRNYRGNQYLYVGRTLEGWQVFCSSLLLPSRAN